MGRGLWPSKGMPPSRNTVYSKPDVPEKTFCENWERVFGSVEGNKAVKSKFERPQGPVRHIVKPMQEDGTC